MTAALSRKAPAVDQLIKLVLQRLRLAGGGRARSRALEPEAERSAARCAVGERSVEQAALRMSQAEQPAESEGVERAERAVAHAMTRLQRGVVPGRHERDEAPEAACLIG